MRRYNIPVLIVLYHPDENCLKRINSLKSKVDFFIFDNSEVKNVIYDVKYFKSINNVGLAGAITWMCRECQRFGKTSFLFFDQDTAFNENTIIHINDHFSVFDSYDFISHYSSEQKLIGTVDFVINSGTIYPINVLDKCLPQISNYFVDGVDLLICLYARHNNFSILSNFAPDIDHFSEQGYVDVRIFSLCFKLKPYSPWRRREFYKSHFRLLYSCFFELRDLMSVFKILKFIVTFFYSQSLSKLVLSTKRI